MCAPWGEEDVCRHEEVILWPGVKSDVVDFVSKFLECQQVNADHRHPADLLQPHDIPETKWEVIYMDFVVVDKLTKSSHFIPVRDTYDVTDVARLFINEIVCLHGVPKKIISD